MSSLETTSVQSGGSHDTNREADIAISINTAATATSSEPQALDESNALAASLDELDRRLVQLAQTGISVCPEPYLELADQLGCSETMVLERLQAMLESGRIRRIGLVPNHYRLGYVANGMSYGMSMMG